MKQENMEMFSTIFGQAFENGDLKGNWNKSLNESDINSLNFIKLIVVVEEVFQIEVENRYLDINQYETVGQMIETLEGLV